MAGNPHVVGYLFEPYAITELSTVLRLWASNPEHTMRDRRTPSYFIEWARKKECVPFWLEWVPELAPPQTPAQELHSAFADAPRRHQVRRRSDPLRAVLDLAHHRAAAPGDWHSEWAALVALAQQPDRPAPLLGYTEGEGVKWQADDDAQPVRHLSRDAFRKRMSRP